MGFCLVQPLESLDVGGDGDATLLEFHLEGVFLTGLDVLGTQATRNLDGDEALTVGAGDLDADQLSPAGELDLFVNFTFNHVDALLERVSVFEQIIDLQARSSFECFGFSGEQLFAAENHHTNHHHYGENDAWIES